MRKLIRDIVDWAYGANLMQEITSAEDTKYTLSIIIEDAVKRYEAKISSLQKEVERINKLIDTSPF